MVHPHMQHVLPALRRSSAGRGAVLWRFVWQALPQLQMVARLQAQRIAATRCRGSRRGGVLCIRTRSSSASSWMMIDSFRI